jgi:hypothetical protein
MTSGCCGSWRAPPEPAPGIIGQGAAMRPPLGTRGNESLFSRLCRPFLAIILLLREYDAVKVYRLVAD